MCNIVKHAAWLLSSGILMASTALAAPSYESYAGKAEEIPALPYNLSLHHPWYRVKTADGKVADAFILFHNAVDVDARNGQVVLGKSPPGEPMIRPMDDNGGILLTIAPLSNQKGKLHRLSCDAKPRYSTDSPPKLFASVHTEKTKFTFASEPNSKSGHWTSDSPVQIVTIDPSSGKYDLNFETGASKTEIALSSYAGWTLYGCTVRITTG